MLAIKVGWQVVEADACTLTPTLMQEKVSALLHAPETDKQGHTINLRVFLAVSKLQVPVTRDMMVEYDQVWHQASGPRVGSVCVFACLGPGEVCLGETRQ